MALATNTLGQNTRSEVCAAYREIGTRHLPAIESANKAFETARTLEEIKRATKRMKAAGAALFRDYETVYRGPKSDNLEATDLLIHEDVLLCKKVK